jgi:V8-like Glu-specific endopeptidase
MKAAVTFRNNALGALAMIPLAAVPAHAALTSVISERAVISPIGYWTLARMEQTAASRGGAVLGAPWKDGGLVVKTTGREFFTLDGVDYSCSGSVVSGPDLNVIVTAAHCVSDGASGWATNWVFVPGYDNGNEPYGSYAANTFYVPSQWTSGDEGDRNDIAFVTVRQAKVGGTERSVGSVVGTQPIAFSSRTKTVTVFGYPAEAPYNGETLDYCQGPVYPDPYGTADSGIECAMTEGDSGGPWLSGFNAKTGGGTITGVTSFKYAGEDMLLYATTLGQGAQLLYNRAERS